MKLRRLGKSESCEGTFAPAMKADGFVIGAEFDWVKVNGEWVARLRKVETEKKEVVENESVLLEKTE